MMSEKLSIEQKLKKDYKECQKKARTTICLICGKPFVKACNSHTVPQFVLKNIAVNGEVFQSNALIECPMLEDIKGVNNTGTFHRICPECDRLVFANYENRNKISQKPDVNVLREVALKSILLQIEKKFNEKELHKYSLKTLGVEPPTAEHHKVDAKENMEVFRRLCKAVKGKLNVTFNVLLWEKLDYVIPIAYQGVVVPYGDFTGGIVNDIFDQNYRIKMEQLNIAVFPLESESIVIVFYDSSYKKLNKFANQFMNKTIEEQLAIINYIIFLYTEDYFLSPALEKSILEDEELKLVCRDKNMISTLSKDDERRTKEKRRLELVNMNKIPNLLSAEHKIR